jgi:hypothetical protein
MISKLTNFDDRKIYRKLDKMSDIQVMAYFLNANLIIRKRMDNKQSQSEE